MNNKGFGGILLILAIFLIGAILFSMNIETKNQSSAKELPIETKIYTTNFELNLTQMTNDCNWNSSLDSVKQCIDLNADLLLNQLNSNSITNCIKTPTVVSLSPKYFFFNLDCNLVKEIDGEIMVAINFQKKVLINLK